MLQKLNNYGQEGFRTPVLGTDIGPDVTSGPFISFLPDSTTPALIRFNKSSDENSILTHAELHQFVKEEFNLTSMGIGYGHRVALVLPNSPELAVCLVCLVSHWCAAPINVTATSDEIIGELNSTKAIAIIIMDGFQNDAAIKAAQSLSIGVILIKKRAKVGLFDYFTHIPPKPEAATERFSYPKIISGFQQFSHPEIVLLLHTSGTSGNKKCVPYTLDMILIGAGCIISSWNLKATDKCLNMMPLFHIGGIVRNLFSPIFAGGSVICCPGFDPILV